MHTFLLLLRLATRTCSSNELAMAVAAGSQGTRAAARRTGGLGLQAEDGAVDDGGGLADALDDVVAVHRVRMHL